MKNKKASIKSFNSINPASILGSNLSESTGRSSWLSQQMLAYYKHKSKKLEKDYDDLLAAIDEVRTTCDLSHDLQQELKVRNEEVYKLQQLIGDLQVHLFREREENLKLTAENDQLKIQDYENKKKINMLLMVNGTTEKKFCHFMTSDIQGKFVESKLPPKLQKLKTEKQKQLSGQVRVDSSGRLGDPDNRDPQILILNNQLLASQLEHHIKISREQIEVLLREKDLSREEREIERKRLQGEVDVLSSKLKETRDLLCQTTEKLTKLHKDYEKERTSWTEEKGRCVKVINGLRQRLGVEETADLCGSCSANSHTRNRFCIENEAMREKLAEKEEMAAAHRQEVMALETEIGNLRERAEACRRIFKEKTEKMTAHVLYLKNKYEDLDRRRLLEAEGFRTDIKMLRERLKELEKKLSKASGGLQTSEQQQLLVSARNTLNRAKLLEKELTYMKSKINALESNPEDTRMLN